MIAANPRGPIPQNDCLPRLPPMTVPRFGPHSFSKDRRSTQVGHVRIGHGLSQFHDIARVFVGGGVQLDGKHAAHFQFFPAFCLRSFKTACSICVKFGRGV
jgi:hypothetical protein